MSIFSGGDYRGAHAIVDNYRMVNEPFLPKGLLSLLHQQNRDMDQSRILVDVALKAWSQQISRAEKFFDTKSDEELLKQVAPGRNRLIYLLGHLVSTNESMMTLFELGPKLYPSYEQTFTKSPDQPELPPAHELRRAFKETNANLTAHFSNLSVSDWLARHTAMTDEDLAKEPTRNKLSVLMGRTSHVAYHLGQAVLVK